MLSELMRTATYVRANEHEAESRSSSHEGLLAAGDQHCRKFERVFRNLDEDGDGKISPRELRSGMKVMGEELTEEEAEAIVESLDSDGDGLVGYEDFVRVMEEGGGEEEEEEKDLKEAFAMYEMDGSGCITPRSLKQMLSRLGESKTIDECRAMICRFDLNGDGVLSFEEFRRMMV